MAIRTPASSYMPAKAPATPAKVPATIDAPRDTELERVKTLARILDGYFVDPLIGLFLPGIGDVIGSMLGVYIVSIAARRKVSPVIIARMLMNLAADASIGIIPLLGDLFDFKFKAHKRNAELLSDRSLHGGRATWRDWLVVAGAALAYVAIMTLVIWGAVLLFRRIF